MTIKPSRQMLVPLIIATTLFMENLDSTVLATALPTIAQALNTSPLHLNLAITSYLFSLAVFIPISGWLADRFGARLIFRLAIVIFMAGSVLCGLGQSLTGFVLARLFQGLGGAMMVPVGRLVLMRSVERHELVRAMAYLTFPALIGPVIGPPLGGFLVTYVSWHWIFWINIPIGLLGLVLATLFIEDVRDSTVRPFDFRGFCLTGLGFTGLIFGFEAIGRGLISQSIVNALLIGGAASLLLYVLHARRRLYPVIDLSLLQIGTFRAGVIGGFLFRCAVGATPFLLPMMLQLGFGLSAFTSGSLTFASAAGAMLMKLTAGRILRRFGFRQVLVANALISAAFILVNGLFRPETPGLLILTVLLIGGFFRSLQFTSINSLTVAEVPRDRLSQATSFSAIAQQLSLSFGVGIGALSLHLTLAARSGGQIRADSFLIPFLTVGLIAAFSALVYLRLPANAGSEVTGHAALGKAKQDG
ncbi:MFS transporter [Dongia soli]|uniref:MFS transporter n=1 Tax=Dongia soli TaxID=600628 RepID=A0ABU5E5I5_9PROT|nr:MFS transporter [Dongia soli]MDY0881563.1 MFS transporter [Dongia soli]